MNNSYDNAFNLMIGKLDYKDLGSKFWLPINHEDPMVLLKYYESIEDYEKCSQIKKEKL